MARLVKNYYLKSLKNINRLCLEQMTTINDFITTINNQFPLLQSDTQNIILSACYNTFIYQIPYLTWQPLSRRIVGVFQKNALIIERWLTIFNQLQTLKSMISQNITSRKSKNRNQSISKNIQENVNKTINRDITDKNQNYEGTSFNPVDISLNANIQALNKIMDQVINFENYANVNVFSEIFNKIEKITEQISKTIDEAEKLNEMENWDGLNFEKLNMLETNPQQFLTLIFSEIAELFEFVDLDSDEYNGWGSWGYSIW